MDVDRERREAIAELVNRPDPPELGHRGHRLTVEGRASRFAEHAYLPIIAMQVKRLAYCDVSDYIKPLARRKK